MYHEADPYSHLLTNPKEVLLCSYLQGCPPNHPSQNLWVPPILPLQSAECLPLGIAIVCLLTVISALLQWSL